LAAACPFDDAAPVAAEKLLGDGPPGSSPPRALGAWLGGALAGVAAVAADRLRLLAVAPAARGRGVGSALLAACEEHARAAGAPALRALGQPGNYLAPGVDVRNAPAIEWLARRGYAPRGEPRTSLIVDVRHDPRVTDATAAAAAARCAARGYELRRARAGEAALVAAIAQDFGAAWAHEVARALGPSSAEAADDLGPCVHVALRAGEYCAFAAHDGNNRGLGWFGPAATWPAHRGAGLGEAVLLASLVDVARAHSRCEVAWIGPRSFYAKVVGIAGERQFVALERALAR
jgi:GNAT superfamily N-acetyltransferase